MRQLFRVWLGVTEYLFRNEDLLDEAINTAIEDNTFRSDDLEFTFAARVSGTTFSSLFYFWLCCRQYLWPNRTPVFPARLLPASDQAESNLARHFRPLVVDSRRLV